MAHGYSIAFEDSDLVEYERQHKTGEKTKVQLEKVGTQAAGGISWLVNIKDPNGNKRLGRWDTKKEARKKATQWMYDNPKGVQGSPGVVDTMNAMDRSAESIFRGGGLF